MIQKENNKDENIINSVFQNYKVIIVLILIIICSIIFYRETKVIGTLYGAEHNFAEIDGIKYTTNFERAKKDKYIGKVKERNGDFLFRVYTVKGENSRKYLIIEGVENQPYLYIKDDR